MIDALVGKRVDLKNIGLELEQRLLNLERLKDSTLGGTVDEKETLETIKLYEDTSESLQEVRTKFVLESVSLLTELESCLLALAKDRDLHDPSNDKEMLGLMDQRMIHTMLEIIVCWGIYPCLLPGVGMPLTRRVRSNIVQKDLFTVPGTIGSDANEDRERSTTLLWDIISPLARITIAYSPTTTRFTTLGSILVTRHVPDAYAALLQLAYRPLPKSNAGATSDVPQPAQSSPAAPKKLTPGSLFTKANKQSTSEMSDTVVAFDPERSHQLQQKEESAKMFNDLFWGTEAARSLESLTVLLGSSPLHPVPVWLKSVCGRFLSQILLKPGGVRVVLEYMQGGGDTVKLDQLEKVARLVSSVPEQMSSVQEYYHTICPELLDILEMHLKIVNPTLTAKQRELNNVTPPSPQLVQTTTFVVGRLLTKSPAISQIEIVAREVTPLWKWGTRANKKEPIASDTVPSTNNKDTYVLLQEDDEKEDEESVMDPLVVTEYEVTKSVMFLHSFLVGNEPSPPLFQAFLSQAALGLYQLYEFTSQIRSILREKIKDILVVYLRILDPKETIEVLKSIVMRRRPPVLSTKPWQNQTLSGPLKDLVDMGTVSEIYYAPGPTGGAVLRRRRTLDRTAATQLELDVDLFLDFIGELETSGSGEITGDLYMYLLDEYQAGKVRGSNAVSPRRMLTMLQLILSMTQKLGPSIMSKVTQIIGLANNILEHQVQGTTEQRDSVSESAEDEEDNDDGEADMEILGLVLTLLSAILNENENLSQQDRHLLALTLIHMEQLSTHPLIEIRRVAHDLQTLIPTRLTDTASGDKPKKTEMEIEMEKYASALAALQDSLLPVRAHGLHILREMILSKSVVLTRSDDRELGHALDIFIQHVQEPDSFIYLNAVKGLAALTDAHGPKILAKLMSIYANADGKQTLDTRLRIGEALVQTVQRCGEALGGYTDALFPGLYAVMDTKADPATLLARAQETKRREEKVKQKRASEALLTAEEKQERKGNSLKDKEEEADDEDEIVDEVSLLRSSALTILATAAETCPTAMLPEMRFLVDWVLTILDLDKQLEVRRAATLVIVLLFRALGGNSFYQIEGDQLKRAYRTLRYVEQVDEDPLIRAQARAGIADLDAIVRMEMRPGTNSGSKGVLGGGLVEMIGSGGNSLARNATDVRYK
ncbi:transmembrane and coiled-coil domains-containing protein 7 [Podila humilis]|nr:transmembrane and coiled-coil domains-containing protein 7 [Podila humilis]